MSANNNDDFHAIRPYQDHEVAQILSDLIHSHVPAAVCAHRLAKTPVWLAFLLRPLAVTALKRQLAPITSVSGFQAWLYPMVEKMLAKTTTSVQVSGLDELDSDVAYTFVSNHRDIALDPTLINAALMRYQRDTCHIAIGDNLLQHQIAGDVMRLNKSFVVPRSISNKREKLKALKQLSAFIRQMVDSGHSVWIAQREGRSKDGRDLTDPAVLKMLSLEGRARGESFSACTRALNVVPVCIAYEWDPSDVHKAQQYLAQMQADYQKDEREDFETIVRGLDGFKGHAVVHFGAPIALNEASDASDLAQKIDQFIQMHTPIWPVQCAALKALQQLGEYSDYDLGKAMMQFGLSQAQVDEAAAELGARLDGVEPEVQRHVLSVYAMALIEALNRGDSKSS